MRRLSSDKLILRQEAPSINPCGPYCVLCVTRFRKRNLRSATGPRRDNKIPACCPSLLHGTLQLSLKLSALRCGQAELGLTDQQRAVKSKLRSGARWPARYCEPEKNGMRPVHFRSSRSISHGAESRAHFPRGRIFSRNYPAFPSARSGQQQCRAKLTPPCSNKSRTRPCCNCFNLLF